MNLDMSGTQILLVLLQGLLIVSIAVLLARAKQRSPLFWGILSLFFGIYALFFLVLLPKKQPLSIAKPSEASKAEEGTKVVESQDAPSSTQVAAEAPKPLFTSGQLQTADWYFINEKKESEGPFRLKAMQEFVTQGKIDSHSWVWCELLPQWKQIETDVELQKAFFEK